MFSLRIAKYFFGWQEWQVESRQQPFPSFSKRLKIRISALTLNFTILYIIDDLVEDDTLRIEVRFEDADFLDEGLVVGGIVINE